MGMDSGCRRRHRSLCWEALVAGICAASGAGLEPGEERGYGDPRCRGAVCWSASDVRKLLGGGDTEYSVSNDAHPHRSRCGCCTPQCVFPPDEVTHLLPGDLCKMLKYVAEYHGVKTKDEKVVGQIMSYREEQRMIKVHIRMR